MESNLRILQSFKKVNEKIEANEKRQKEINDKTDDFLKDISEEIKEIDNENKDLKKELTETIEKVKQEKPKDGKDGIDGRDGKDGYTPVKGIDYFDGVDGKNGLDGTPGRDGYTPIKGKDYFDGKDGLDGVGVYDAEINEKGELILKLTNGKKINCGVVKGKDGIGFNGVGISKVEIIDEHLIITLTTGKIIDAGSINNGEVIPTKTSELENDSGFLIEKDLKEYAKTTDIPNVSDFITKDVSNLTNYYDKDYIDEMLGDIEALLGGI